jgi:YD repeat-containing protein
MMLLTKELLIKLNACDDGISFCERSLLFGFDLDKLHTIRGDYDKFMWWIGQKLNQNTFDEHLNLIRHEMTSGGFFTCKYDKNNNKIQQQFNDDNDAIFFHEYDDRNNKIKHISPYGDITIFEYNEQNKLIRQENTLTNYWEIWEYDDNGNLIKNINSTGKVKTNTYDSNGNLLVMNDRNYFEIFEYDNNNRKVKQTFPSGAYKAWKYDSNNNVINSYYSGGGKYAVHNDENTSYEYDDRNNKIKETYATGAWYAWEYDDNNNVILRTNVVGEWWKWEYDDRNNLISRSDFSGFGETRIVEYYDNWQLKRYDNIHIPQINTQEII